MIAEIENIKNDSKLTPEEKEKRLKKLGKEIENTIQNTIKYLYKDYKHCPYCDTYYRKESYEYSTRKIVPKFTTTTYPGCNEIVDAMTMECPCYICPKGHKILDDWKC